MIKDKYSAVWISHSSISDYLKCPRAYYLKNVYRDSKTNHKITLITPSLTLGQIVHEVIETLSSLPKEERFSSSLQSEYEKLWFKVAGKKGGFKTQDEEAKYKKRGALMIQKIMDHPGPLSQMAIKIRQELPYFWISQEDNLILCGKIDWLEYIPEKDGVRIIDFKTGKADEDPDSLQLPIYLLLARNCQKREVVGACYWYLDRETEPYEVEPPDIEKARAELLEIGKRIALARKLERFVCKNTNGCFACRPFEKILKNEAEFVGVNDYNADVYILN